MLGSVPILKYASLHRSAFLLPLLIALLAATALSEREAPIGLAVIIGSVLAAAIGLAMVLNWGRAQDHWQELQRPILQAMALLIITIALLISRVRLPDRRRQVDWGLVGLVFVDLFLFDSRFNPTGPISALMPPTPGIEYLQAYAGLHRAVAYQLDDQVLFGPNILSTYGIAEASGYSSLVLERFHQLVAAGDPELDVWWMNRYGNMIAFSHPSRRLLDLLQVAYVVSPVPLADPGVRAELVVDGCEDDSGEIAGRQAIGGAFVVRDTAINRLDLRFRVYRPGETSGTLLVRMWQGADRGHLVLDARLGVTELEDRENVTLYFAPEKEAPGRTYRWEVTADRAVPHTSVALCTDANGEPSISVYGADWAEVYQGEVCIFERLAALPRAYVVYAAEHISDDGQAVSRLLDESFDLRNVAVTADPLDLPARADIPASRAEIVAYRDTQVVINASAVRRGLLILGDQYYPGWQAYLDGQPTPILRVNHILRGVIIPPGDHQVVFQFLPSSLRVGGEFSLAGIAALMILVVLDRPARIARYKQAHGERGEPPQVTRCSWCAAAAGVVPTPLRPLMFS